jgi:hypothetical protein
MPPPPDAQVTPASPAPGAEGASSTSGRRWRVRLLAALCAVCLLAAGGYTVLVGLRAQAGVPGGRTAVDDDWASEVPAGLPRLMVVDIPRGARGYRAAWLPLDNLDGPRHPTTLQCDRVYFAAGQGVCLKGGVSGLGGRTYSTHILDAQFQPRFTIALDGLPSRARVSPDGRYAAVTAFVEGDSYNSELGFSTRTKLVDTASGAVLADLEEFVVWRGGERWQAVDFNFWGVTFARDGNRFFATLASDGRTYLVEGDISGRTARVLREGVECPSLSPDNTRLAFKKRVGTNTWELRLLDLATLADTPLPAEKRSIDDQVEWLDDSRLVYAHVESFGLPEDAVSVWVLPTDGGGPPSLLLRGAYSPAVVRSD